MCFFQRESEIFPHEETLNHQRHTIEIVIRLPNILKLDQQFIYFNAEEIFSAFEVECEIWKSGLKNES